MLANPDTYGILVLEFSFVTVLPDPDLPKTKYPNKSKQMYWLILVFLGLFTFPLYFSCVTAIGIEFLQGTSIGHITLLG